MAGIPIRVDIDPTLEKVDKILSTYAPIVGDLRPFWELLGRSLSDDSAARWPLRRRSGRLRRSLKWSGDGLGRGGIFKTRPDRLLYGTRIFYAAFSQVGTAHQAKRPLIHVNEDEINGRLSAWASERARAAGFSEVTA